MLYDIFKKSGKGRGGRSRVSKTPLIVADVHEKNSLVISELYSSRQVRLEVKSLKIADYLIGNIAIERKSVSDLISSMINKRLVQQLVQMKKYKKQILIIEGDLEEVLSENSNISKALRGFILSVSLNYGISVIQSVDCSETSKYLITLAKQQSKPSSKISLHSRIPKSDSELKSYILESFPGVGPVTAEKLLKKFPNLLSIFKADEEELSEILKSKSGDFKSILES